MMPYGVSTEGFVVIRLITNTTSCWCVKCEEHFVNSGGFFATNEGKKLEEDLVAVTFLFLIFLLLLLSSSEKLFVFS